MKLYRTRNPDKYVWCTDIAAAITLIGQEPEMIFEISDELIMEEKKDERLGD